MRRFFAPKRAQQGATLIVALVFLLVLTVAGITAMRFSTFEERMASNSQFRNQVFQQAQSEIRAQLLAFNTNLANRAPLLLAMGKAVAPRDAAALLADPSLKSLPITAREPQALALKMTGTGDNIVDANTVRYVQEGPCDDGSSAEKFVCIGFEMSARAETAGGSYSSQSQGMSFQNNK